MVGVVALAVPALRDGSAQRHRHTQRHAQRQVANPGSRPAVEVRVGVGVRPQAPGARPQDSGLRTQKAGLRTRGSGLGTQAGRTFLVD